MNKGFIHIYTGCGKGKTTAAIGLSVRAAGAGKKVLFAQFLKQQRHSEHKALECLSDCISVECFGTGAFVRGIPSESHIEAARKGYQRIQDYFKKGQFDVIVLDELFAARSSGLLSLEDIISLVEKKPEHIELILTGRDAPQELIDKADLVTEMVEIKHYYHSGIPARIGIEM
jgi:cob(I)alamin adenosyltransferase